MPPNEPAESMVPAKNARFSGSVRQMHVRELVARVFFGPLESLGDHGDVLRLVVAQPAVAFENAVHQALHHLRIAPWRNPCSPRARRRRPAGCGSTPAPWPRRCEASITSSVFGVQPTQPLSRRAAARQLVLIGVAGDEGVFVEHQAQRARRRLRIEIAQHGHGHAGFLREVANEELALVELRGRERLAA